LFQHVSALRRILLGKHRQRLDLLRCGCRGKGKVLPRTGHKGPEALDGGG
jgi:hypothetical protein